MPTLAEVMRAATVENNSVDALPGASAAVPNTAEPIVPQVANGAPLDPQGIAVKAAEYQRNMEMSGRQISAADAVAHVISGDVAPASTAAGSMLPPMASTAGFYANVAATWNATPSLKGAYASFAAYQVAREVDHCRATGMGLEQLRGESNVAEHFLSRLFQFGRHPSKAAEAQVHSAFEKWDASADLRREFVSFEAYATHVLNSSARS